MNSPLMAKYLRRTEGKFLELEIFVTVVKSLLRLSDVTNFSGILIQPKLNFHVSFL